MISAAPGWGVVAVGSVEVGSGNRAVVAVNFGRVVAGCGSVSVALRYGWWVGVCIGLMGVVCGCL